MHMAIQQYSKINSLIKVYGLVLLKFFMNIKIILKIIFKSFTQ